MDLFADTDSTVDLLGQVLGVLTALVAIVTALTQVTQPAILRRRERWLKDAIEQESNAHRKSFLSGQLDGARSRILSGFLVPGWRFVEPLWTMALGALQFFFWQRDESAVWEMLGPFAAAVLLVAMPMRRIIRLLCERARIAHEYREARDDIKLPRLGLVSQMEGGARIEFLFALLASVSINLIVAGIVLFLTDLDLAGLLTIIVGGGGVLAIGDSIRSYVRGRVAIYGPWSTADPNF